MLQDWEVRNVTGDPRAAVHRYEVRPIVEGMTPEQPTLTVRHRPADGAQTLTATVMRALAAHAAREVS